MPIGSVLTLAGIAVLLGLAGAVAGLRRTPRVFAKGVFRDLVRWLAPATALAAVILFFWMTIDRMQRQAGGGRAQAARRRP